MDPVAKAHLLERREGAFASLLAIAPIDQRKLDILDRVQSREQVVRLEDETDVLVANAGELAVGELSNVLAGEDVRAAIGHVEASEDVHER